MKTTFAAAILIFASSASYAQAKVQNGMRCTTTQTFTWPVANPDGKFIEHTVKITMDFYGEETQELQTISSAQAAWKTCNQTFGQKFNEDWRELGLDSAPFPIDEFGQSRPPKICVTIYKQPELYRCEQVTREPSDLSKDPFVLVERTVLK